jgi:hypothetical protein
MYAKVKEILTGILERFKTGDIPQAIAYSIFPIPDIPSSKWSIFNRTLMFFAGTQDARGFKQWQGVNRYVKKGAKAFHILAPRFKKKDNKDNDDETILIGFLSIPVFRLEDTDGEPLDYQQIEVPELPLIEVAEQWNISVKAVSGNYRYIGYYSDQRKEIALATEDEVVFFHELSHAAHAKIKGNLKPGQDWKQEIVAELSAATLSQMVGKRADDYLGNNYRYIETYAKKANLSPLTACLKVMADVENVLQKILGLDKQSDLIVSPGYV